MANAEHRQDPPGNVNGAEYHRGGERQCGHLHGANDAFDCLQRQGIAVRVQAEQHPVRAEGLAARRRVHAPHFAGTLLVLQNHVRAANIDSSGGPVPENF
jgi:hypothetical protein